MVKIYVKGNYFFLVKDNIEYEGHRKEVLIKRLTTTSTDFFFKQVNNWNDSEVVSLSDMVDENDVAYTLQAFLDFRKDETGNFNNGGGNGMGLTELEVETLAIGVDLPTDDYTDLLRNIQFKPIAQNIFLGDIYDAYTNSEAHRQGIKDDYGDGSSETITIPFLRPYTFGGEYSLVNRYIRYLPTEEVKFLKIRTANNTTTGNLVIDIISASEGNEVTKCDKKSQL